MTFEEWWDEWEGQYSIKDLAEAAWEAAFEEGVKWTLQQDANTLNKLQLTLEEE